MKQDSTIIAPERCSKELGEEISFILPEDEIEIDVALIPIGGRDFTMNLTAAVQAAIMIKPLVAIPMHRFEGDPQKFKKQVEKKSDIKVAALQTGEVYHLK